MANTRLTVQNDMLLAEVSHAATQSVIAVDDLHDLLESGAALFEFFHRARLEVLDITEKIRDLQEQIHDHRTDQAGRVRRRISKGMFPLPPPVPSAASQTASPRDAVAGPTQSQEGSRERHETAHAREC